MKENNSTSQMTVIKTAWQYYCTIQYCNTGRKQILLLVKLICGIIDWYWKCTMFHRCPSFIYFQSMENIWNAKLKTKMKTISQSWNSRKLEIEAHVCNTFLRVKFIAVILSLHQVFHISFFDRFVKLVIILYQKKKKKNKNIQTEI